MRFGILGPVEVRRADESPVVLAGPKVRALLALLLVDAGRVVSTGRLIDGIYGDTPPEGAANALQSQVSRLRRSLGVDAGLVEFHSAGYRLAVDPSEVDAHQFERLAEQGRRALVAGDHHGAAKVLGEALELWRGPALADLGDLSSARTQAARLEELRLAATEDHVQAQLELGQRRELVPRLRELVAAHPLRERLRGQLMRALAGSGRQAEALTTFEDARRTLAEELGADPSAELAEAHLAVLRGEQAPVSGNPLPAQLTSFVGRDEDLDQLGASLGRQRLVTLTGPGGTGKTRLAIEAAGRLAVTVCFVELAPVTEGADVPQAVLAALGLRDGVLAHLGQVGRIPAAPTDRLVAALAERPLLLVLDNCEHLIEAAAQLAARLLAACPQLRVLATSREPLGITGETLYPVPRLALAPPDTQLAHALDYPAVRLFADRAAAGRADFTVDDGNLGDVLRICHALDGLPLAIELAAARVRTLPVADIATRLGVVGRSHGGETTRDDRFDLLSRGSRTAAARHRTLRAVVEWSWDLLDADERELARRLTVFAGGATLAAAEWVCQLAGTVEVMSSLVDKSLVEVNSDRYRMLETIRAFCVERLVEAGESDRLRRAHAEYFLRLAETADPHLLRGEQLVWLARLDAEYDNLHAALRWALDADIRLALRLISAVSTYWWMRGRRFEGATLSRELTEKIGPRPPEGLHQEYVLCVLNAAYGTPDHEQLRSHLDVVEALVRTRTEPPRQPLVHILWGMLNGPPKDSVALANSVALASGGVIGPDPWSQALEPLGNGLSEFYWGYAAKAERSFTEALERFRAIGERWGMTQIMVELSQLASWRGEHGRSLALIDEAIELTRQLGAADETAEQLCRRADCKMRAGDPAGAQADYERAEELARGAGWPDTQADARLGLAELARQGGTLATARRLCEKTLAERPASGFITEEVRMRALVALARVAAAEGKVNEAASLLRQALDAARTRGNFQLAASAVEALAEVALVDGDGDAMRSARLLGAGTSLRGATVAGDPDVARVAAAARERMGSETFETAYAEGLAMSQDEALTLTGFTPSARGA